MRGLLELFLLSHLWKPLWGLDLSYDAVLQSGKSCQGRDSCKQGRNARGPIENDWKKRNCFCDNQCVVYDDCCIDALSLHNTTAEGRSDGIECINLKQYGPTYMKTSCNFEWADPDIRSECEKDGSLEADPFGNTPVTSIVSGFSYKNYYCGVCNSDSVSLEFWKPRLECPTLTGYANRFKNITRQFILRHLKFNKNRQWGVEIDTGGVPVFHVCSVDPAVPETLTHLIRPCPDEEIIDSCPETYSGHLDTLELCSSYTGLVYGTNSVYRNVHCAKCNNAEMDDLECFNLGPLGRFNWQKNFNSFSFAILFDLSGTGSVGKKCDGSGQIYDPFFKKCRNVICGTDEEIFRNGKCQQQSSLPIQFPTEPDIHQTESSVTTLSIDVVTDVVTDAVTDVVTSTSVALTSSSFTTILQEIFENDTTEVPSTIVPLVLNESETIEPFDVEIIDVDDIPTQFTTIATEVTEAAPTKMTPDVQSSFLECPKIELNKNEFTILPNSSIFIARADKILDEDDFMLQNDSRILICAFERIENADNKFSPYLGYVSLACLGISVLFLCLHIIASLLASELQNLSGKNLLSLSTALLGSYLCFIAAMFNPTVGCSVLAVIMYYFFMASFVWMLVISFDVFRSLKLATIELRLAVGVQWKKFTVYSLIGWITPLLFVVIVVVLDITHIPARFKPAFAHTGICWFSNKTALLFYFAIPVGIIMVTNVALFVGSALMVFDATRSTPKMSCVPKINFHLYLRLGVLMGLTWITGLVAGFLDLQALWIVFIGLNTLQGLFIFLAFTCTRKVYNGLKERATESWIFTSSESRGRSYTESSTCKDSKFGGRTMYTVSPPKSTALPTSASFDKRYY